MRTPRCSAQPAAQPVAAAEQQRKDDIERKVGEPQNDEQG
jgi:hypothetical protein